MMFEKFIKPPLEVAQHVGIYVLSIVNPEKPEFEPIGASIQYFSTDPEDVAA